jgi:hypothetical protein
MSKIARFKSMLNADEVLGFVIMTRCLVHLSAVGPAVQAQDRGRHDGEEEDHGAVRLRG